MKNLLHKYNIIFLLIILPINVFATNCDEKSPNFVKQGDLYFDIKEVDPLSNKQKAKLLKLFSSFKGKNLTGTETIIECIGSTKKTLHNEIVTANILQSSDAGLTINIESYNKKKKVTYNDVLTYLGANNVYHLNELSTNKLVVSYKLRPRGVFNEEISEISINNRTLTINVTRYIGGYFGIQHIRKLRY